MTQQIIHTKQDLTYLSWAKIRNSSGTAGSFLKSYSELDNQKIYYKLSDYDRMEGIIGHECINEIVVDRLLDILGVEHLHYQLIHADIRVDDKNYDTYLCASSDFKKPGENKIALEVYYDAEKLAEETPLEFCIRQGWEEYIYQMLVVDFLILNRDRHGANIEVLRNSKQKQIRMAPLFDHGLSLLCRSHNLEDLEHVNVMEDKAVQCFVGGRSAQKNLGLIPLEQFPRLNALKEEHKDYLFEGLTGVMPKIWQDKIWEMLWKRWRYYESFCNQR